MRTYLLLLLMLALSGSAFAVTINCQDPHYLPGGSSPSGVWINSAIATDTNFQVVPPGFSIYATDCEGLFVGNDNPLPTLNTGGMGDGLLNGADQTGGHRDPDLDPNTAFEPGAFITVADLQDLVGNDGVNDPGWILLGKDEAGTGDWTAGNFADTSNWNLPQTLGIFDLTQYLTIGITCSYGSFGSGCGAGDWNLTFTDPTGLLNALAGTVFGDSFFDHLAFSFKAGGEFVVYDFDFNLINAATNGAFDLSVPHNFEGTFDVASLFGTTDISHLTIWARDPVDSSTVNEPAPILLMLLATGLLAIRSRKITGK
ncbi:hypothetical protein [Aestuariibacter salexigens]|uniref:hypothetical protein n=1 Tax=Aestuariibacter salexigens TaxID=226010 RepID=UPI00041F1953|nr:hypothetical protein [Aestuariibacter salexigens]